MASGLMLVLILLCVIVVPIAMVAFARSGKAYDEIGKGRFAVDFDESGEASHHEEVRQLVEAKAYRQERRGEEPVDVDFEVERLLRGEPESEAPDPGGDAPDTGQTVVPSDPVDPELVLIREEIRQVVVAKNESRMRRGEEPLDVETEVDRILNDFG